MLTKKTFFGVGIIIFLLGIFLFGVILPINYSEFISFLIKSGNIALSKKEKIETLFTITVFKCLQYSLPIIICLLGISISYYCQILSIFFKLIYANFNRIILFFKTLSIKQKYLLFFIVAISFFINLYHVINLPIYYDEAWTYRNFTNRSFIISITKYPAPNNHVLHSILTNLTKHFPFSSTINLRIPNLITALFSSLLFFYTFFKMFSQKIAFILLPMFCFVFGNMYFAYLSRGYMLVIFSFLICFYATMKIISQNETTNRKYLFYLSIGGMIGFFTMPSFLYPYFTCISYISLISILNKDYTNLKNIFFSGLITTIFVILFYLPIMIVSGLDAIINNKYVEPIARFDVLRNLFHHFNETFDFLFGIKLIYIIPIVIFSIYYFIKNKIKSYYFIMYCFFIAPILLLIHSVIPFYRTWIYWIIPFLYGIGLVAEIIVKDRKYPLWILLATNATFSVFLLVIFNHKIKFDQEFSYQSTRVANYIISQNMSKIYCHHPLIENNLLYLFEVNNRKIDIKYSSKVVDKSDIKMIKENYDLIITSKKLDDLLDLKFINNWDSWEANTYLYKTK
jgi:hypothetical protein